MGEVKYRHATCACKYPRGKLPLKTLCGLIETKPTSNMLKKCPACEEIFGNGACPLCPAGCLTC